MREDDDSGLMKALEEAKPKWQTDNLGLRGNPEDSFRQQTKIEWPDPDIVLPVATTVPATAEVFIPTVTPIVAATAGGDFPFKVTVGVDSDGDATWSVGDGAITGVTPSGTDTPKDVDTDTYSIYLKVNLGTDTANNYRTFVTSASITDDNSEVIASELLAVWDDPATKLVGHFYVKIADLTGAQPTDKVVVTSLIQILNSNILSFVVAGDEVIIVA